MRMNAAVLAWVVGVSPVWAAQISTLSPQGAVSLVKSIQVGFDADVVSFGDAQAAAPVDVVCNDPQLKGEGRWLDGRRWTYLFNAAPGPGVSCTVQVRPSFRTLDNEPIGGKTQFAFQTGGPVVVDVNPSVETIAEDQVFIVRFNAAVDAASVAATSHCLVQGLGEAVPVRLITGSERKAVLKAAYYWDRDDTDTPATQLLQCKRRLPSEARVQLSVGPGVAVPATTETAGTRPTSAKAQVHQYTVRAPFKASFSCERENSSMPCTPLSDLRLDFSAPVSREQVGQIRLLALGESGETQQSLTPDDTDAGNGHVQQARFRGPFAEHSDLTMVVPQGLTDDAGRNLSNADQFPLSVQTAAYPPLVKFAAAPFGVVERFAQNRAGAKDADAQASVPLTLRRVEPALVTRELAISAGKIIDLALQDDAQVVQWYARVNRLEQTGWTSGQLSDVMAGRAPRERSSWNEPSADARGVSVLNGVDGTRRLTLPGANAGDARPFEVIGVPLAEPGFHVLEIESPRLGESLLGKASPMYVRTSVLLTSLGVHVKTGRDDMLAWVTTLDDGRPVAEADIAVLDCSGKLLARGKTDARGVWHHRQALDAPSYCEDTGLGGTYVSARIGADHILARGKADFSFAFSDWNRGIEPWRFNVPTDSGANPTLVAHTVLDRALLRAGETVSMKHFLRAQTRDGLGLPSRQQQPDRLIIEHQGSDQRYELPVAWRPTASGGLSAVNEFAIPSGAALGTYVTSLASVNGGGFGSHHGSGQFRVEEFKLPLLAGTLRIGQPDGPAALVAPAALTADVQLSYVSGGPAGNLPVTLSGVVRERSVSFVDYDDYSFDAPGDHAGRDPGDARQGVDQQSLFLDKQTLVLDADGAGRLPVSALPAVVRPQSVLFEASFTDPNGEIQTLAQSAPVWPASVQAGIRAGSWVRAGQPTDISALALMLSGQPKAGIAMTINAIMRTTYSTRQRLVGGFYGYDNHTTTRQLGTLCEGATDPTGRLACTVSLKEAGELQLIASATDDQGRISRAVATVWVTGAGDLWFGGDNDDRIDIIPARKNWKPGETAEFQVRMPFRQATALVAIEREGILEAKVVTLRASDPTLRIPVKAEWGPNVYVSVLAVRGRVHEVPWTSFFTWGWQQPASWYSAFAESSTYVAPTPFVDLAKPSFRFGVAQIRVSDDRDQLSVSIVPDRQTYQVRDSAGVTIKVTTPDGKPAAHGTVAFAAVDQALLELAPNPSWELLTAMRQYRGYGVDTATAQMQVVGRRHYGRKALPTGGGGGMSPTRELFDTLLMWQPDIRLDANGTARIQVPLNDAITRFTLVAIADHGPGRFGTASASIASIQDLQVISGLPAVVREGDTYVAVATVRNATARDMPLTLKASYTGLGADAGKLADQSLILPAGASRTLNWTVAVPFSTQTGNAAQLSWILEAQEDRTATASAPLRSDRIVIPQRLIAAVPIQTRQATLLALGGGKPQVRLPMSVPAEALRDVNGVPRGGVSIRAQSSLGGGLAGVDDWFSAYPYTCLEQVSSKAIGLRSTAQWDDIMQRLPDYLDDDGLLAYFPGAGQGSEVLTAYLLGASHEAESLGMAFAIPDASRRAMTGGLLSFVEGRLVRQRWAPQRDLHMRKLMALEALSRYGLVQPRMLDSMALEPDQWATSAVIDWLAILQRVPAIPNQPVLLDHARQILRARLSQSGTMLRFDGTTWNDSWWLMMGPQANLARLVLSVIDRPEWEEDIPRMVQGLLSQQHNGAWRTTTANLTGSLAIEKFARTYESTPVTGHVQAAWDSDSTSKAFDWEGLTAKNNVRQHELTLPWPTASTDTLVIGQHGGNGQAWLTVRAMAAVPAAKPVMAGLSIKRRIEPIVQAVPGVWSRGDIYRVKLDIMAGVSTTWAVLSDPIPAGATILGGGQGRDSSISTQTRSDVQWRSPSYIERKFDTYRAYYDYLPAGPSSIEYIVRLNTVGKFQLPPTRIEAMYQPDIFGELPNLDGFVVESGEHALTGE